MLWNYQIHKIKQTLNHLDYIESSILMKKIDNICEFLGSFILESDPF